ncbi:MAG TPA: ammonia-forming cytochrome c nitrite reductase subunit c552 [Candidatus Wallbacteria bacterium]|nr:ammonia-forming cytochrome c nitrite reductase subunit c552 [Candidatus Wallbacteria bacterium]
MNIQKIILSLCAAAIAVSLAVISVVFIYAPSAPVEVKTGTIAAGEFEPSKWGQLYPLEYDSWVKTREPRKSNMSKYKKGWDDDGVIYDKLSEFPYMALLFNGWGFGIEYNEPRGHHYMMIDQNEIDASRVKAGGACLTCKTPYADKLARETKGAIFSASYKDAVNMIPENHRQLGVACIDCHDNKTMDLKVSKWTILKGLENILHSGCSKEEMRNVVCAQCHVTYIIPKDADMKSTDVIFPWKGGKWGDISVETIIANIKSSPAHNEWKQAVTGFKVGFIRHPEFEFFTRNSTHFKAGASCADCHMPYKRVGANKISDHDVKSPLKENMRACLQCHAETPDWLRERVNSIQEKTVALMNRSGYAVATAAKLFELAHKEQEKGKTIEVAIYEKAKDYYLEAFYRSIFLGAENSVGFHNPPEAMRIAGDSVAYASKAEALLRQGLTRAGVEVPVNINLELSKYINQRGTKKLNFRPEQEFTDPTSIQDTLLPKEMKGL